MTLCVHDDDDDVIAVDTLQQGWSVDRHHQSPDHIRQAVTTMMTIRVVEHQPSSVLAWMPNELMFLVFAMMPMVVDRH